MVTDSLRRSPASSMGHGARLLCRRNGYALALGCLALVTCHHEPASRTGTVPAPVHPGPGTLVADSHCFELHDLGAGWTFELASPETPRGIQNVVATGVREVPSAIGRVVVNPHPVIDLERAAREIHQQARYEEARIVQWEATEFAGEAAFRSAVAATFKGKPMLFGWVIFNHQHHHYLVEAWAETEEQTQAEALASVASFFQAFRLRPGRIREDFPVPDIQDLQTTQYNIRQRRFQSATTGLVMRPSEQWRFIVDEGATGIASSFSIGLVAVNPSRQLTILADAMPQSERSTYQRAARALCHRCTSGSQDRLTVSIAGRPVVMSRVNRQASNIAVDVYVGIFCRDTFCYRLLLSLPRRWRDRAQEVADTLPEVQFMEEPERQALEERLARAQAEQRRFGPDYALTPQRFVHFPGGVTFDFPEPPSGDHRLVVKQQTLFGLPDGIVSLLVPRLGLHLHASLTPIDEADQRGGEALHHEFLRRVMEQRGIQPLAESRRAEAESLRLGDTPALLSEVKAEPTIGGSQRFWVVTARRGQQLLFILVGGPAAHVEEHRRWLRQLLAGVEFHSSPLPKVEREGRLYRNHQLGFELQFPDEGWIARNAHWTADMDHVGGVMCHRGGTAWLVHVETPTAPDRNIEWYLEQAEVRPPLAGTIVAGSRRVEPAELDGLPAVRATLQTTDGGEVHLWVLQRPGVVYQVMVAGPSAEKAQQIVRGFSRL